MNYLKNIKGICKQMYKMKENLKQNKVVILKKQIIER
jgi:hypothetical protein